MFVKCRPKSEIAGNVLRNKGQKFSTLMYRPICSVIPQNQNKKLNKNHLNRKGCDDFNVARSTVRAGYFLTSRDAIWTNRVHKNFLKMRKSFCITKQLNN